MGCTWLWVPPQQGSSLPGPTRQPGFSSPPIPSHRRVGQRKTCSRTGRCQAAGQVGREGEKLVFMCDRGVCLTPFTASPGLEPQLWE